MLKRFLSKGLLATLSFLCIGPCFALQIKPIVDNSAVKADISIREITRIAIEHDRIVHVRGLEGAYALQSDPNQGAIFIRPTADYQSKPFTLFLATEQNHNYVLHLTPKAKTADTILLKPSGIKNENAMQWETGAPYTQTIVALTTAMMTEATLKGYTVDVIKQATRYPLMQAITVQLVRVYSGAYLQGYVYRVMNSSHQTCDLHEQAFYQRGDRAIALSQLTLAPNGEAWVYKVRSDE